MAKKSNKRDLDDIEPDGGDLPYLLTLDADEKHEITVDLSTMEKEKNGGPDGEWSCYRITIDKHEESEVPFYMMKAFKECIADSYSEGEDEVELIYKRKVKGDKNIATFQEA